LYSTDFNPKIKFIKDVAAGAVLIAAMYALGVACFIFIPLF
jgi:diacylglycerol kinase (ATP)